LASRFKGDFALPISVVEITSSQRTKLVSQTEGHFLEFKAIEVAPAKLSKHLSAFANADGGDLYVGIDDASHEWRGFSQEEDANGHIGAFEALFPLGQDFSYSFLSCHGQTGLILQALIQKTRDIKYATDGKPYLRRGAQSLPVTSPEALRRLE
jgi:ATP-dependent DNA helicase RecG